MNNDQVIEQLNETQRMVRDIYIPERSPDFISPYLGLPGLIGFWPMATVQRSTGNVPNYAPTYTGATKQDLVYNGNPTFNYTTTGVPYIDLDGTGDYLSLADNTDIDILGTESWAAVPGLTMGGWFRGTAFSGGNDGLMSKWGVTGVSGAYMIYALTGTPTFIIEDAAGAIDQVIGSSLGFAAGSWYFIVGVYVPSTSIRIYINEQYNENAVGIPAALRNNAISFEIGNWSTGGNAYNGDATLNFLCANALSQAIVQSLFQQTRQAFGV